MALNIFDVALHGASDSRNAITPAEAGRTLNYFFSVVVLEDVVDPLIEGSSGVVTVTVDDSDLAAGSGAGAGEVTLMSGGLTVTVVSAGSTVLATGDSVC